MKKNQFVEYARGGLLCSTICYSALQTDPILVGQEITHVNIFGYALVGKFGLSMATLFLSQGASFDLKHTLGLTDIQIGLLQKLSLFKETPEEVLNDFEQLWLQAQVNKV